MKKEKKNIPVFPLNRDWPLDTVIPIETDPLGSYTGVTVDVTDKPVQDADDL